MKAMLSCTALAVATFQALAILQLAALYQMLPEQDPLLAKQAGGGVSDADRTEDRRASADTEVWPPSGRDMSGWAMAASGVPE